MYVSSFGKMLKVAQTGGPEVSDELSGQSSVSHLIEKFIFQAFQSQPFEDIVAHASFFLFFLLATSILRFRT